MDFKIFNKFNKYNDSATLNSETVLKEYINACLQYGSGSENNQGYIKRYPNFLALDYVDQGEPLKVIDWINQRALDAKKEGKSIDTVFPPFGEPK